MHVNRMHEHRLFYITVKLMRASEALHHTPVKVCIALNCASVSRPAHWGDDDIYIDMSSKDRIDDIDI